MRREAPNGTLLSPVGDLPLLHIPKWLHCTALAIYAFFYIPIVILILYSFDESRLAVTWTGFTFKWYESLFNDRVLAGALLNSLTVASIAVIASGIMGTLAAVGLAGKRFRGEPLFRGLIFMPVIIPEIAMAVAALTLFLALGMNLSLATIIVSHIVFCTAYVALTVMGSLEGIDPYLAEAAQDLGCPPHMVFFRVTLPLIAPGIFAGCLLAFVLSLDDFVITQFTAGVGDTTLPLRIYSLVKFGISPEINALSTLMILGTISLTVIAEIMKQRKQAG
jgi:spermidine/putrescine transport system permease protein